CVVFRENCGVLHVLTFVDTGADSRRGIPAAWDQFASGWKHASTLERSQEQEPSGADGYREAGTIAGQAEPDGVHVAFLIFRTGGFLLLSHRKSRRRHRAERHATS